MMRLITHPKQHKLKSRKPIKKEKQTAGFSNLKRENSGRKSEKSTSLFHDISANSTAT
jgi:hypothetical protein